MTMPPDNSRKARLWMAQLRRKRSGLPFSEYMAVSGREMLKLRKGDPRLYECALKRIDAKVTSLIDDLSLPFEEWKKRLFRRARRRTVGRRRTERR